MSETCPAPNAILGLDLHAALVVARLVPGH